MKKRLFLLLVVVVSCTATILAQTTLVATLTHSGKMTNYYGGSALAEAYEASVAGDVITLSSGTFKAVDISKAVTVRGAGMTETVLDGDFTITGSTSKTTTLEGCQNRNAVKIVGSDFNEGLENISLVKNCLYNLRFNGGTTTMMHCLA